MSCGVQLGTTALHDAAEAGSAMIVQTLIAEGASVECQDNVSASTPSTLYHCLL